MQVTGGDTRTNPRWSGPPEQLHARARKRAAMLMSIIGIAASLLSLLLDEPLVARGNGVLALVLAINLAILWWGGRDRLAAIVGLAALTAFVLWVAPTVGIRAYFWLHVLPPVGYFMLGLRGGLVLASFLTVLLFGQLVVLAPPAVGSLATFDVLLSFVTVCLVSHVAERARSRYQAALAQNSLTDALTGLANRRASELALQREALLASRGGRAPSVVLFDVDEFKSINDRFGHAEGDHVLQELASVLRAGSRASDLVGRWGGEELICVLPGTDSEGARRFAEKMRRSVREHAFRSLGQVTVSAGVAELSCDNRNVRESIADCLSRADAALYRAKHQGRDQVVLAVPMSDAASPAR